jgi:hypothetical protein
MKPRRTLTLRREALTELTNDDLGAVVGAVQESIACTHVLACISGTPCNLTSQPRCF